MKNNICLSTLTIKILHSRKLKYHDNMTSLVLVFSIRCELISPFIKETQLKLFATVNLYKTKSTLNEKKILDVKCDR